MAKYSKKPNPYKDVVPRLTISQIRALRKELPSPNTVWKIGDATFKVYRTKDWFSDFWHNDALYKLLIDARGSYYIYNGRSPLDKYDAKSASYLVQAVYPLVNNGKGGEILIEEWLSDRLVPCTGDPLGGGELELFVCHEKSMNYWFQEKFFERDENYLDYTVASNRMCTISPYFVDEGGEKCGVKLSSRQKYTGLCYALMSERFLADYMESFNIRYSTSILNPKVTERSMVVEWLDSKIPVTFTSAYQLFGMNNSELINFNRSAHNGIVYRFPGYFLEISKLAALLKTLFELRFFSESTLRYYFGEEFMINNSLYKKVSLENFRKSGSLLTVKGKIKGSILTGEELRWLVDKNIPDGAELKITKTETIKENLSLILSTTEARKLV